MEEETRQQQLAALYGVIFTESLNGHHLQPKLGKAEIISIEMQ